MRELQGLFELLVNCIPTGRNGGGEGDKNVPKPPQNRTLLTIVIAPPLFRTLEHPLDFVSQRPSYRGLCGGCRRPQLPFRGLQ